MWIQTHLIVLFSFSTLIHEVLSLSPLTKELTLTLNSIRPETGRPDVDAREEIQHPRNSFKNPFNLQSWSHIVHLDKRREHWLMSPWKPGDVGDVTEWEAQTTTQFIRVLQRNSYCLTCSSQCYVHGSRSKRSTGLSTSNVGQDRPSGFSSSPNPDEHLVEEEEKV